MKKSKIKQIVKKRYNAIAVNGGCCSGGGCCSQEVDNTLVAKSLGYSDQEIGFVAESNLGLGCGNPTAMANIKQGDTVLDLGSGAGFDCFLATRLVGKNGHVLGIDISESMIAKAVTNAQKYKFSNVEFKLGDIESLPITDSSIDVVISNCVINLAPDKDKVFREIHRVLKSGGKAYISDIVLLKELPKAQENDEELLAGCVGGALLKKDYLKAVEGVGLLPRILSEDIEISERQYNGISLESLKLEITKK